jgi:hypothetical protein
MYAVLNQVLRCILRSYFPLTCKKLGYRKPCDRNALYLVQSLNLGGVHGTYRMVPTVTSARLYALLRKTSRSVEFRRIRHGRRDV